jgi:hypothetical protein
MRDRQSARLSTGGSLGGYAPSMRQATQGAKRKTCRLSEPGQSAAHATPTGPVPLPETGGPVGPLLREVFERLQHKQKASDARIAVLETEATHAQENLDRIWSSYRELVQLHYGASS